MPEKNVPMTAISVRPTISWRMARSARRWFSSRKRLSSSRRRPNTLLSRIPDTDSVSSVIALISALDCCACAVTFRRTAPARYVYQTNSGVIASESTVSCQEITVMAMTVLSSVTTLDSSDVAVSVTTDWIPPTSLVRRDWISPVRVPVKKRSDIPCRCAYSRLRRSSITRWPTRLVRYVCPMPIAPVIIGMAIITPART